MDRYELKLVGKREMYIPYNSYKANDNKLKYKDMVDKGLSSPNSCASNCTASGRSRRP